MVLHCEPDEIAVLALGERDGLESAYAHIQSCSKCQAEFDQLCAVVRTGRSVTAADFPSAPPAELWQRIDDELHGAGEPVVVDELAKRRNRRSMAPWIGIAAAAGLVVGGLGAGQVLQGDERASVVASTTLEPLPGNQVIGNAVVEQTSQGPILSVSVPDLPQADGYYEVWLLKPDVSNMVSIGVLGGSNSGTFPLPPNLDLAEFSVVDISREAYDGDATHSTDSVVRGVLPA
jgi:anti-sigma-K factor RskA